MITLRPATLSDSDNLFTWRNDPMTCANSRSTAAVARADHDRWVMMNVLQGYPAHMVIIAETEHGAAGVVRFDRDRNDVMRLEASITIAPKYRGQAISHNTLHQACEMMRDHTIDAEMRRENIASRKLFESCGFEEIGRDGGFLQFRKEPS